MRTHPGRASRVQVGLGGFTASLSQGLRAGPCRPACVRKCCSRHLAHSPLNPSPPAPAPPAPLLQPSCSALRDPYATLGVSRGASEKEVKQAHRALVKKHHPDCAGAGGDPSHVAAHFIRIQEAYELITGKRKDVGGTPGGSQQHGGWDFHDWFWAISMKRRHKRGGAGAAATEHEAAGAPPPPEAMRAQWKSQLGGLRQKAAAKRGQPRRQQQAHSEAGSGSMTAGATSEAAGPSGSAAAAARESVWRSTTKNARSASHVAAADEPLQTLGSSSRGSWAEAATAGGPGASSSHVVPAGGKHWRAHLTEALQALPRAAASHGWGGGVEGPPAADKQRQQQHFHHHHQGQQQNQHQASSSGHARKFADRSSIEERLGGQLAGMRRRATLKQTMI